MITIRKASDRGTGRHGWLTTHHTFSFANYYDPKQMGFRTLRVINEDTVAPGRGFGAHQHDNMEIVSIVLEGALAHKDSTGGEGVLRRGANRRPFARRIQAWDAPARGPQGLPHPLRDRHALGARDPLQVPHLSVVEQYLQALGHLPCSLFDSY